MGAHLSAPFRTRPHLYAPACGSRTVKSAPPSGRVLALTDRTFDDWRDEALTLWPQFSDAVVTERRRAA